MGVDIKKAPPLPAPTETDSTTPTELATEVATDVSKPIDDKSSYSIPEDGTPVTIKTRGHKASRSQTSLLIEYFEGGKPSNQGASDRKPSVRVRLTPSKNRKDGHVEITQTKSSRKASLTRRAARAEQDNMAGIEGDDAKSMSSYASATEESNVSRNPIEVEIDRSGGHRRRRPASPLIPAADSKVSYAPPSSMSEISAIPTDSFLDGSGPSKTSVSKRSKSPSRGADMLTGAAAGLAAAAIADKVRSKGEKERIVIPKSKDREKSERKQRSSRSRTSSVSEKDGVKSPKRRSSRGHQESAISAVDSSVLSSAISGSRASYDERSVRSGASKSSINNPKLLETVEDAIRRLILPELNALKREQSRKSDRRGSATSSATSVSKDEYSSSRRRSSGHDKHAVSPRDTTPKVAERRDREARHDVEESPSRGAHYESFEDSIHESETPTKRSSDKLKLAAAAAAGAGLAAAAMRDKSPVSARETRRRRRAEQKGRGSDTYLAEESQSDLLSPGPQMPLMSEINPSELTRTSILSAETDRPHSASEELMPVHEVPRGVISRESITPTPTTKPSANVQALGAYHENVSHGDLKSLPRGADVPALQFEGQSPRESYDREIPLDSQEEYETVEDYEVGHGPVQYDISQSYDQYGNQVVPAPLKYTPYQPERRGLSPIPSVSGYTEGGSEVHTRDSRITTTTTSSPEKSPRHDRGAPSPGSILSNVMSRDFDRDDRSLRSSGVGLREAASADSGLHKVSSGQDVRHVGATAKFISSPVGVESAVASLVDGSMLEESVLSGEPGYGHKELHGHHSMGTLEEEHSHDHATLSRRSYESRGDMEDEEYGRVSPATTGTNPSEFDVEYEIDQYGRKIPKSRYPQASSATEAAITAGAVGAAAAAIKALQDRNLVDRKQPTVEDVPEQEWVGGGVQRNKSFKERTMEGYRPANTPTHSIDRLSDYGAPQLGATGMPDMNDPMPELGYYDDGATNPSVVEGPLDGSYHGSRHSKELHVRGDQTPTQRSVEHLDKQARPAETNEHGLGLTEAAGAAALATAAAMAAQQHSRQPSQDVEEDWPRTSADRKRDTLITNPYEGTSPVVNENLLKTTLPVATNFGPQYHAPSPIGHKVDEGYISQGPNKSPDIQQDKAKGVEIPGQPNPAIAEDPFYTPKHVRHMSGLSQGMGSPLYDAATGAGLDRIENKDIIALMQHLMVRDAQRSARDTEILVTLVRAASEMREKFEYMEKQLKTQEKGLTMELRERIADTEDVIITEVKENTEKTVRHHIGGPRPFPGSGARSLKAASQAETEDLNTKKSRNLLRRAFKGLSAKGNNDLGRIEDMLNQLLAEVDVLKSQTAPGGTGSTNTPGQLYDGMDAEVQYEQDRGYEPEGHAGTSTASHASQSGHLSLASRGPSAKLGYDQRKFSDHRISTVPEADEGEFDRQDPTHDDSYQQQVIDPNMLTPHAATQRGSSAPLSTPPHPQAPQQGSLSNDNTPRTDKGKKHKSSSSSSWFPKISRWSNTTASSKGFRLSKDSKKDDLGQSFQGPSRSGSDLAAYPDYRMDPDGEDKLPSEFLEPAEAYAQPQPEYQQQHYQTPPPSTMPENPRYQGFRNSMNLQHPQPRSGQPFTAALEHQYYDSPMSPGSMDWAGSTTSLRRATEQQQQNPNRYSNGSATNEAHRQYWPESPSQAGPPRPPKEPVEEQTRTPAKSNRISKLQKSSPLPHQSVESGYGTATHGAPTQYTGSPRLENRNLSGALGVPTRRPSGPRAMTPKSDKSFHDDEAADRRRKRDTFGTVTSQESETF